eukprot:scaffold1872_cov262-Amphora_coffeaeformis.AAC.7
MAGHVAIAWTLLYGLMNTFTSYCHNEVFLQETRQKESMIENATLTRMYQVEPPPLTKATTLTNITRDWVQREHALATKREANCAGDTFGKAPCTFAFIAGPAGTVRNERQMISYLKTHGRAEFNGWKPVSDYSAGGYQRKLGLVATKKDAAFTVRLENVSKEVRVLNPQTLKSYGEKWANSTARFTLTVDNPGEESQITSFDIEGFHDDQTSISYPFICDLGAGKAVTNGNVTLKVDLVGGTTFKIIAMMFCNR